MFACERCGHPIESKWVVSHGLCSACRVADESAELKKEIAARKRVNLEKKRVAHVKQMAKNRKNHERIRKKSVKKLKAAISREEKDAKKEKTRIAKHAAIAKANEANEENREKEALRELAERELARRRLLPFILRNEPAYDAGWVHKDICERLERFSQDVADGKSPRLMLFMPPRHGKSLIASQYFPAWHMGRNPTHEIIAASYAQTLQIDFSKKIQELVRETDYQKLFPGVHIPKGFEAVERWSLAKPNASGVSKRTGGGLLAAGVGGPITGRGAHVFLIDDPVKNREEADSPGQRESNAAWFSAVAYTRLAPGAGIVIIQTRWHDGDLSGWILERMREAEKEAKQLGHWPEDADKWEVISYPAIATKNEKYRSVGEALHPTRYNLQHLLKMKRTMAPRDWAALMQQTPVVEEGAYFDKNDFRFYTSQPQLADLDIYAAGDPAISQQDTADWTVFVVVGVDKDDNVWVLDERRGRWDTNQIVDQMFDIQRVWKPKRFGIEKGHISMTLMPHLDFRRRQEKFYSLVVDELPTRKRDKEARARPIQGRMKLGMVKWPEKALWVDEFVNEMLRFPNGVNDDRVDAIAWVGWLLAGTSFMGRRKGPKKLNSWKEKLRTAMPGGSPKDHMAA